MKLFDETRIVWYNIINPRGEHNPRERRKKMNDFTHYDVEQNINFIVDGITVGNCYNLTSERLETKAIRKYKDATWEIQGLINNSIAINNSDFDIKASITLYGVTDNNDSIIVRHLNLEM